MKKFFAIALALLLILGISAALAEESEPTKYTSGDYRYILLPDGTAEITDYTGKDTALSIPAQLDGYTVTSIGDRVFLFWRDLTEITLPEGLTSIGNSAFSFCESLTKITLPEGLKSIGEGAFLYCESLTEIVIPDSVTAMGVNPFAYCSKLTQIRVSPDNAAFAAIDGVLFHKQEKKLVSYPKGKPGETYAVPQGIAAIGDSAFSSCGSLTEITLPEGLKSIGYEAFSYCDGLKEITLPEGLTSIGHSAFSFCEGLTEIVIPDSVTAMGVNPFVDCSKLTQIKISPDNAVFASIDGVLFHKQEKKLVSYPMGKPGEAYAVPQGIAAIGEYAFSSCDGLTEITLPEGLTSIGYGAFSYCDGLKEITLPEGLTSIEEYAFYYCDGLKEITLPAGLMSIGDRAFYSCYGLKEITLPETLKEIGEDAFDECPEDALFTVVRDSYAAKWCKENGKNYTYPDANDWLLN